VNLFQQQEANRRRTTWLVIGFVLFFAWLGFGGDFIVATMTAEAEPDAYRHAFPWIGVVVTGLAVILVTYAYRTGPEKVLWATGAREIETPRTDPERQLVNVVEEMCVAAALPKPRIWVVEEDDPNAFATGHDPRRAHLAVTTGLLAALSRDELQAVIGHELGHVKNLDVRLMTTLAAIVGAVALISDGLGRAIFRGGVRAGGGSRGGKKGGGGGALILILLAVWLLSWILAPIITQLLAMGVSRKREYLADAMSAQFTRNPLALASALHKIESAHAPSKAIKRGAAHLCIADPLGRRLDNREGLVADIFATHPPMAKRIAMLKGMGYAALKGQTGELPA
jgi:heat shock protein HtpX